MSILRRLLLLAVSAALCVSLLAGCGEVKRERASISVCLGNMLVSLDPIYAEEPADQTILCCLYENLMRVKSDGAGGTTVVNGMAKSVRSEKNPDGTVTCTFRLRDAEWSDGRSVTAQDYVYAWQRLADSASQSPYASLLSMVSGYDEARAAGDMSLMQVTAKNSSTLVVVLDKNYELFLREVCTSPATLPLRQDVLLDLKEMAASKSMDDITVRWWSDPTMLVTNGAYVVKSSGISGLVLSGSESYYGEVAGPESLTFNFASTADMGWMLYSRGQVDLVWPLPEDRLTALAEDPNWTGLNELATYTVLFNGNTMRDLKVRQALSLAVDRDALAAVAGPGAYAAEGLVPYGVPARETDFRTEGGMLIDRVTDYETRCEQAMELLDQSGYENGSYLGNLEYKYVNEGNNSEVAEALCKQWNDALHTHVVPVPMTEAELWTALYSGDYTLAGMNVAAVGNDAEYFLSKWTSASGDNMIAYENSAYDTLMSIIAAAADETARLGCLHDAEALLLNIDCAIAPLYASKTDYILRDGYSGVCRDARGWFVMSDLIRD